MPPKLQIVGNEDKAVPYILWAKRQWELREGTWYKHTGDCLIQFIRNGDFGFIRFITELNPGFAVHPRTDQYPYGANFQIGSAENYEQLTTTAMFPLYDNDNGTMRIFDNDDEWEAEIAEPDNYGILPWTSDDTAITWRGFPGITLGFSRDIQVEGVTVLDVSTMYATYYTPLASQYYKDGESLYTPGKVRGAGVSSDGTAIVTIVNYTQFDFVGNGTNEVNPNGLDWLYDNPGQSITDENKAGKVGGYYDELYVQKSGTYYVNNRVRTSTLGTTNQDGQSVDGWIRIGYTTSSISNLSMWFSDDGKSAECDEGTWTWSYSDIAKVDGQYPETVLPDGSKARPQGRFTSSFTARVVGEKKYLVTPGETISADLDDQDQQHSTASMWNKSSNLEWYMSYMQSQFAICQMNYEMGGERYIAVDNLNSNQIPLKYQTRPDPTNYYIDVFRSPYPGQPIQLTPQNFKSGPYTWQGDVVVHEDTASATISYDDYTTQCGIKTVTVTDKCGFSATVGIKMHNGTWCGAWGLNVQGSDAYPEGCCNHTDIPCQGCHPGVGLMTSYWTDDRAEAEADLTATTYTEYKHIGGSWCGYKLNDVVCTILRTWTCGSATDCTPLPPIDP